MMRTFHECLPVRREAAQRQQNKEVHKRDVKVAGGIFIHSGVGGYKGCRKQTWKEGTLSYHSANTIENCLCCSPFTILFLVSCTRHHYWREGWRVSERSKRSRSSYALIPTCRDWCTVTVDNIPLSALHRPCACNLYFLFILFFLVLFHYFFNEELVSPHFHLIITVDYDSFSN